MATAVKHVGNFDGKKVVVAYKTMPNEHLNALLIPVERLPATYHDELFSVVESQLGQDAYEIATVLAPKKFSDGNNMLVTLAQKNFLVKVETKNVTMTPTPDKATWIQLDKLNEMIAEQRGVAVTELAVKEEKAPEDTMLTKKDTARNYRNRADAMYKEVVELRRRADEIDPPATTKSTKKTKVDA